METSINKATPVEYELEIHATAEDLEPRLNKALREQSKNMDVKGFRKGKVPLGLVKKMHGQAIGYQIAEEYVQEVFESEVADNDDIDPIGQPELTKLDYEVDSDLNATIRFGVRPDIELKDLSDEELLLLDPTVTEEDVEQEIERLLIDHADLVPLEDEPAGEKDFVSVDLQRIDPSTDTPIIGDKDEDLTFFLDDERLKTELREALIGKEAGDTFRVTLPQDAAPGEQVPGEAEDKLYEVTVNDVKRRDLPEFDDAFVAELTDGEYEDPEALRDEIFESLKDAWSDRSEEMVRGEIIDKMIEMHPVPVPESVIEGYLDSFEKQVEQQNDGELPEDFDRKAFRLRNREDAENQGRWMMIRDTIIEEHDLGVTDDDLDAFIQEQAGPNEDLSVDQLKQFYTQMPQMKERVEQQILSDKVLDFLLEQFNVTELDRDAFREEMEKRHEAAHGHAHGHDHDHDHDHDDSEIVGRTQ